jgi:serine/threonine protein kinase
MAQYHYQVETTTELFEATADDSDLKLIGRGGVADVYLHNCGEGISFALKIYRDSTLVDWDKIAYQVAHPMEGIYSVVDPKQPKYAWPLAVLKKEDKNAGIVLPYVDKDDVITLDHWIESHLLQKIEPYNDSLSRKISILANLADVVVNFHNQNIAIVDLKPSNIVVYRRTGDVCLLDCDSLKITTNTGQSFQPTHVTGGYILPEAIGPKMDISSLGAEQDLYAFAVIAFQVLNYGIHPYQGILSTDIPDTETNDQKAKKALYSYGFKQSDFIAPLPQSTHLSWPKELRLLFDAAFTPGARRAPIKVWCEFFKNLLDTRSLARCQNSPSNVQHIRFNEMPCASCMRERAVAKIKMPVSKDFSKSTSKFPEILPTAGSVGGQFDNLRRWDWFVAAVILGFILLAIFSGDGFNNNEMSQANSHQQGANTLVEGSNEQLCSLALSAGQTEFELDGFFRRYTNEARRQKLTVNKCREILGKNALPAQSNNTKGPILFPWKIMPAGKGYRPSVYTRAENNSKTILAVALQKGGKLYPYIEVEKPCYEKTFVTLSGVGGPDSGGEEIRTAWRTHSNTDRHVIFPTKEMKYEILELIKSRRIIAFWVDGLGESCEKHFFSFSLKGSAAALKALQKIVPIQ